MVNLTVKKMFAIDALGATVSALMLGVLLPLVQSFIGMPTPTLIFLAVVALGFSGYSFCCFKWIQLKSALWLWGIIIANLSYCGLTLALMVIHQEKITLFGMIYFISEIVIIFGVVVVELIVLKNNYLKKN